MKTEEEIRKELKKLEGVYRYTNDATELQKRTYIKMKTLEWVLEIEEE